MQLHTVEAYFIEPLKQYFEKDPKDGAESYIVEKLDGTDPRVLTAAVDWIKGHRQSQSSFPSPKECFAAIDAVAYRAMMPSEPLSHPEGAKYGDKLKAWLERNGSKSFPIIKKDTPEWTEWEIYFLATGNKVQYPLMENRGEWTTPTRLPQQFDPNYDWSLGSRLLREKNNVSMGQDAATRKANVERLLSGLNIKGSDDKAKSETASAGWQQKVDDRWAPSGSLADRLGL